LGKQRFPNLKDYQLQKKEENFIQVRLTFEEEHFRVDLVFYNRLLRCFVLFDLKIGQLKHQDIIVEMTLPKDNNQIFASK